MKLRVNRPRKTRTEMITCEVEYYDMESASRRKLTEILQRWGYIEDDLDQRVESMINYRLLPKLSRPVKEGKSGFARFKDVEISRE